MHVRTQCKPQPAWNPFLTLPLTHGGSKRFASPSVNEDDNTSSLVVRIKEGDTHKAHSLKVLVQCYKNVSYYPSVSALR